MQRTSFFLGAAALLAVGLLWACGSNNNGCAPGYEGCACGAGATCETGLSCISNLCVDPTSSGSGGGVDVAACSACWDAQCGTQREACNAASPCGDVSECVMNCIARGDFTECPQGCAETASNAGQEAVQAYGDLWTCVSTSCTEECFTLPDTGTGGAGPGGGDGTGGTIDFLPPTKQLRPLDGWVHIEENTLGIQGSIYTFRDFETNALGSTIYPESFEGVGRSFCVNGTTDVVQCDFDENCDYETRWGAGAGMNLAEPPGGLQGPFNATAAGVTGFSFDVAGSSVPNGSLRFKAVVASDPDSDYCIDITSGPSTILLSQLRRSCWLASPGPAPDPTQIRAIQWQVVTNEVSYSPFDFCIGNVTALP